MIPKIIIDSYARKHEISIDDSINVFNHLEQFLDTAAKEKSIKPTTEIDHAWHHFILNTKEYYKYCITKYSAFIHHIPNLTDCSSCSGCSSDVTTAACESNEDCQTDVELGICI